MFLITNFRDGTRDEISFFTPLKFMIFLKELPGKAKAENYSVWFEILVASFKPTVNI